MKLIKKVLLGFGITALGTTIFVGGSKMRTFAEDEDKIADGVYIGAVSVGGMTEDEAQSAVEEYMEGIMSTSFTLSGAKGDMTLTASDMGITSDTDAAVSDAMAVTHTGNLINRYKEVTDLKKENKVVSMHLSVDKQKTASLIYDNQDSLNVEAVDSTLKRENGEFVYVEGTDGVEVDIVNSVYAINDFLENDFSADNTDIALVTNDVEPKGSKEELSQIKDLLGTFSTDFSSSSAARAGNVANACSKVNGSIIYPGEEFSVYQTISPITVENGYGIGGAYSNGQVVESVGGGVCQVATTLYNAVIRAELEITMRYNHSMKVAYVSPSDDAAIAGDYKDLRFVNNMETPVYIEGYCSGGIITFNVYGVETRDPNREVSFESETISTKDADPEFNLSSDQELGYYNVDTEAHQGCVAKLWKIVTVNGKQESREEFNNSTYQAAGKQITVGTKGATDEQISAIKSAASSGDEDKVKSAIAAAVAENKKADEDKDNESKKDSDSKDSKSDSKDSKSSDSDSKSSKKSSSSSTSSKKTDSKKTESKEN